jgi:hypothetical protein
MDTQLGISPALQGLRGKLVVLTAMPEKNLNPTV